MSSVIALNQIDGSELWKKVGFKPSEKVLVSLRGVYNLPFNLDDPVSTFLVDIGRHHHLLHIFLLHFLAHCRHNFCQLFDAQITVIIFIKDAEIKAP